MSIHICAEQQPRAYGRCATSEVTYEGAVLDTFERNGYHDSDFYAVVWTGERITAVEYASTRGWTYHNYATVDATPQVIAAAEQYLIEFYTQLFAARARQVQVNARVRSTTTRGQARGVEGVVKWMKERRSRYGSWSQGYRVGIAVEGETKLRFVDADKVQVLDEPNVDEIREQAAAAARRHSWRAVLEVA